MRTLAIYLMMITAAAADSLSAPPAPLTDRNYIYIDQIGSGNSITIIQDGSDAKQAAVMLNGDTNDIGISQTGGGNHTAYIGPGPTTSLSSVNSGNNLTIVQEGDGTHNATIQLTDSTGNGGNTASIYQSGGAGADKSFTLQLSGNNIGVSVVQDNPTVANTGSMSISCYTGSCTGYSYTRH